MLKKGPASTTESLLMYELDDSKANYLVSQLDFFLDSTLDTNGATIRLIHELITEPSNIRASVIVL